jgi:Putative prokaryotic signal transducing protein
MQEMIELLRTTDPVKLSAVQTVLRDEGVETVAFDRAAGSLWQAAIPVRLMVSEDDLPQARRLLREAGFRPAADGDWDLGGVPAQPS